MYFQFLVEDASTDKLIVHVMDKVKKLYPEKEIYYDSKSFRGIGSLLSTGSIMERKTGHILNDLPQYMRGFNRLLQGTNSTIIVVVDNDKRDTEKFRQELQDISTGNMIFVDHVYCIAVKEMEAWLLGDEPAIAAAYPNYSKKALAKYVQDGICDTWEVLANMVYPGGLVKLMKDKQHFGYPATVGKAKTEWADKIGKFMDIKNNKSPSFNQLISEIGKRAQA